MHGPKDHMCENRVTDTYTHSEKEGGGEGLEEKRKIKRSNMGLIFFLFSLIRRGL